jgi:methionyl-tRNA synthetase
LPVYKYDDADLAVIKEIQTLFSEYTAAMNEVKLRHALKIAMEMSSRMNLYLQDNKLDTNLFNSNPLKTANILALSVNVIYLLSSVFDPFMPGMCAKIREMLRTKTRRLDYEFNGTEIKDGHLFGEPIYLFTRIEPDTVKALRIKYGGGQQQQQADGDKPVEKKKGKKESKKPDAVPDNIVKTPEIIAIEGKIKDVGDLVRKLKTEKADPEEIKKNVNELLKLKQELQGLVSAAAKN